MVRSYKGILKTIEPKKDQIVLRHDIDFDIRTARRMLEIEREYDFWSIVYVDVHSPSYSLKDIEKLYEAFCNDGFLFGIHINVAYRLRAPVSRFVQYKKDLATLGNILDIHSCTGHFYSATVADSGSYNNVWLERISSNYGGPLSFSDIFEVENGRCADSGGKIVCIEDRLITSDIDKWVARLQQHGYFLAHPIHYCIDGEDVMYIKKDSLDETRTVNEVLEETGEKFNLSTYLRHPLELIPHQTEARKLLSQFFTKNYDKMYTVVDVACGIGLLGTSLLKFHNVKYIGVDMTERFIRAGKYLFNELGYAPQLIVSDFFEYTPDGDIMILLGYEDCPIDYNKIHDIACKFEDVMITIVGREMFEFAKTYGKEYNFISEEDFESIMLGDFSIVKKICIPKKRVFYWLRRKHSGA